MPEIQGIDVSKHNGLVNWTRVKASGKNFVFIRLGWCGYDGKIQDNNGLDTMFHTNIKGAIASGMSVGVYIYSYAKTALAARIAAHETLELIKPYKLSYPVAFDIESTSTGEPNGTPYDKMLKAENNAIIKAFLSVIENAGYYGLLYTYKSFSENYLNMSDLCKYDVWIAQYAKTCSYKGSYGIWQYAGDIQGFMGTCDGITGNVDLNVAYKDYAAIIKSKNLNRLSQNSGGGKMQKLILPINNSKLTASWKTNSYKDKFGFQHYGIDIVSSKGKSALYSCGDGIVLNCGLDNVLGNMIVIKYPNALNRITGKPQDVICRMWHLASIAVKKGQAITKDTELGLYGNTGQYSAGAHLHMEFDTDIAHPYYTPTLSGTSTFFKGSKSGANDKTMSNPLEWLHCKTSAPDYQTYTTVNDIYIRSEDKAIANIT